MNDVRMTKVKLTGLWNRTDANGHPYLGASLSPITSMLVFPEKKYTEKSPDYAAFLRSSVNDNGSNGKNTVRVKLAGLWEKVGADGAEYLEGKTAPGCYLRIEKQAGSIGGLNSPDYVAYFSGYDNSDGFLSDSTGGVSGSSSNGGNTGNNGSNPENNNTGDGGSSNTGEEEVLDHETYMDESHGFTEDDLGF